MYVMAKIISENVTFTIIDNSDRKVLENKIFKKKLTTILNIKNFLKVKF